MPLARAFYDIDRRGVLIDQARLSKFLDHLNNKLAEAADRVERVAKRKVVARAPKERKGKAAKLDPSVLNISSVPQLRRFLVDEIHLKLKKDRESGEYSTGEEALQEAFAETGNKVLKDILTIRELNKIKGTYAETALVDSILYSSYSAAGTITGRRSSGSTPFTSERGYPIGTNAQNLPKHSELGLMFRECVVARPGKIFVSCDQVQAEDWIVQGLITDNGGGDFGLKELQGRVDRHRRLATQIFNKTWDECNKDSLFRYLGKKTRHAGNYGMRGQKMAVVLVTEGFKVEDFHPVGRLTLPDYCDAMLAQFHRVEPGIQGVFQVYVQETIKRTRTLTTPIGRSRYFFGLRPGDSNDKIIREAFSYIPQSTVGDNTGLAVLYCEHSNPGLVVMDGHDAIVLEVELTEEAIHSAIALLTEAFNRVIKFPNGLELQIPIEFEMGFDLKNLKKWDPADVEAARKLDHLLSGLCSPSIGGSLGLPSMVRTDSNISGAA